MILTAITLKVCAWVGGGLYAIAVLFPKKCALLFTILGIIAISCVITGEYYRCGEPPFGNVYHVMALLAWVLGAMTLFRQNDRLFLNANRLMAALFAIGCGFLVTEGVWQRPQALQSPFFIPHVGCYILGYAFCCCAALLALLALVNKKWRENAGHWSIRYSEAGWVLMTFGLALGALWAEQAWGRFWSWDVKECWSLITWIFYAAAVHQAWQERTASPRVLVLILAGFTALAITLIAVNYFGSGSLHTYN